MPDYGHDLLFGSFITPLADQAQAVLDLAALSESSGLDLVTIQDHPYQPAFLDTWTLLSVIAARTSRVRVVPNVANLPLRPPAVLARAAASLDILSGGRVELGLGTGAFWDAIEAMGGPRRTGGEAVTALDGGDRDHPGAVDAWTHTAHRGRALPAGRREAGPVPGAPRRDLAGRLRAADARADRPGRRRLAAQPGLRRGGAPARDERPDRRGRPRRRTQAGRRTPPLQPLRHVRHRLRPARRRHRRLGGAALGPRGRAGHQRLHPERRRRVGRRAAALRRGGRARRPRRRRPRTYAGSSVIRQHPDGGPSLPTRPSSCAGTSPRGCPPLRRTTATGSAPSGSGTSPPAPAHRPPTSAPPTARRGWATAST